MNNMLQWSDRPGPTGAAAGPDHPGFEKKRGAPTVIAQIMTALRRRYRILIAAIVIFMLLGLLLTLLTTPRYTAVSTLEIQRETGTFVNVQGAEAREPFRDEEFYETQYGLLKAQSLAERVARDLRLDQDAEFMEMAAKKAPPVANRPAKDVRAERLRLAGAALLRSFDVEPGRFSRLVEIRYTDTDPARAQRIIQRWSSTFVQMTLERRFEATRYAREFLQQRLDQLRRRINESETQLVAYASREGIINIPTGGTSSQGGTAPGNNERSLIADNLSVLNAELNAASADRIRAESRLSAPLGQVTEALQNNAISTLRQRRAEVAADYAKMLSQFESGYPPAQALQQQVAALDQAIQREETRVRGTLQRTYDAARTREAALESRVTQLKSGLLDYRRRSINYEILQREVDTNQQLYDALLQRYKEIGVAGGVGVNNISVIDNAELPRNPSSPKLLLNLALALLAGIVIGGVIVFLLEQTEHGIEDPGDVENLLGVPLLGAIPKTPDSKSPRDMIADRKSLMSEAYVSVQTSLGLATEQGLPRTLGITSSRPAEGKSTTSYALAHIFARSTGRVLLIDGDMRSPSVHRMMELPNDRGLSNYLAGEDDIARLIQPSNTPGLSVMTSGPTPPSASELLSTGRLQTLIAALQTEFDHVIFDLPPVMGLADAPLIARRIEGLVFVVEAHVTKHGVAQVALERLDTTKTRIFGVVLSKFDARRSSVGSGYGAAYGYGNGYSYGSGTAKPSTTDRA